MSDQSDNDGEEDPIGTAIDTIVEHQDLITDNKDLIETALEEQIKPSDPQLDARDAVDGMTMTLLSVTDREDADELSSALLDYITNSNTNTTERLKQKGPSDELASFITEISVKYQMTASALLTSEIQGPNFWTNANTDITIRPPHDQPSLSHHIALSGGGEANIDTDLGSNLRLVRYLLNQHLRATEIMGEEMASQVDPNVIVDIISAIEEIGNQLEGFRVEQEEITESEG